MRLGRKVYGIQPGMVAMCCKPSSGAGVVWMETTLDRLGSNPSNEELRLPQGDPTKQLLYQKNASLSSSSALKSGVQACGFETHGRQSY